MSSSVIDIHVDAGKEHDAPDRWDVDALKIDDFVLFITGRLSFTRPPKQYRAGGVALFTCEGISVSDLDQALLADFTRGPGAAILYTFLKGHLNTASGIVGESQRFPTSTPVAPRLLRRGEAGWRVRSVDEVGDGDLIV